MHDASSHATINNNASSDETLEGALRAYHTALHTLAIHLPEVNQLLDGSFSSISEQFVGLANQLEAYGNMTSAENIGTIDQEERKRLHAEMSSLITKTIIDMQFQDRVSQNLVIAVNIAQAIADNIKEHISLNGKMDTPLTQHVAHLLNLGEIRQKFITHAQEIGAMQSPEEYGIREAKVEESSQGDDDIDLF